MAMRKNKRTLVSKPTARDFKNSYRLIELLGMVADETEAYPDEKSLETAGSIRSSMASLHKVISYARLKRRQE